MQFISVTNIENDSLHSQLVQYNGLEKSQFPIILIHDMMKGYDFKFIGELTKESLNEFVIKWYRGPIEPYFKSESFNYTGSDEIIKLSRNNLEEVIFNLEKDNHVIVNFFASWHKNNTHFSKIYSEFFEKVKNTPDLKLSEIDISKNFINDFIDIDEIPTIMMFHRDNKSSPVEFDDQKTVKNLLAFVEQNINSSQKNSSVKIDL